MRLPTSIARRGTGAGSTNWSYELEFKEAGRNSRIHVAEDGTLVRDERPRRSLKSLFLGLQVEDTPAAVQQTIRRLAGDREIIDIDRKGTKAEPVYRVEIKGPQGTQEVHVDHDGKIVYDSRTAPRARG